MIANFVQYKSWFKNDLFFNHKSKRRIHLHILNTSIDHLGANKYEIRNQTIKSIDEI